MNKTETRDERRMTETETWVGNGLALILAALAIAAGVIGLLVGFEWIGTDGNSFQNGMIWMVGGIILAVASNAFRREHHAGGGDTDR